MDSFQDDPALVAWYNKALSISSQVGSTIDSSNIITEDDKLLEIGKAVFSMPDASFKEILDEVQRVYPDYVNAPIKSNKLIIELYLVHAVGKKCASRAAFLKGILSLNGDTQDHLSRIVMKYPLDEESPSDDEEVLEPECSLCVFKDQKVNELENILKETKMRYKDTQDELDKTKEELAEQCSKDITDEARMSQLTDSVEKLMYELKMTSEKALESDIAIVEKNEQLKTFQTQYQETDEKLREVIISRDQLASELQATKEEIELLKPKASRYDKEHVNFDRAIERLDQFESMQNQLLMEQNAHNTTYQKLVKKEKEIIAMGKLMDEFQEIQNTSEKIAQELQETHHAHRNSREESDRMRHELSNAYKDVHDGEVRYDLLEEEYTLMSERCRQYELDGTVGEGSHEVNPEMMAELLKLRIDCADYKKKVNSISLENVALLEKQLRDERSKSAALHEDWVHIKQAHDTLKYKLESADGFGHGQLFNEDQVREVRKQYELDIIHLRSQIYDCEEKILEMTQENIAKSNAEEGIEKKLNFQISDLQERLSGTEKQVEELNDSNRSLESKLRVAKNEDYFKEAKHAYEKELAALNVTLTSAQAQYNEVVVKKNAKDVQISTLQYEIADLKSELKKEGGQWDKMLKEAQEKVNGLMVASKVQEALIHTQKEEAQALREQQSRTNFDLRTDMEGANNKVGAMKEQLQEQELKHNSRLPQESEAKRVKRELEAEMLSLKQSNSEAQSKINELTVNKRVLENNLKNTKEELIEDKRHYDSEIANLKQNVLDDQRRINELNVTLQVQQSAIHHGKEEIVETKTRCEIAVREAKLQLLEAQSRLERMHDVVHQRESELMAKKDEDMSEAQRKFESEVDKAKRALDDSERQVQELHLMVKFKESAIVKLQSEIMSITTRYQQELTVSQSTLTDVQHKLESFAEIRTMQESVFRSVIDDGNTALLDQYKLKVQESNSFLEAIKKELEEVTIVHKKLEVEYDELLTADKVTNAELANTKAYLADVQSSSVVEISELKSALEETQKKLNALLVSAGAYEHSIEVIQDDLSTIKSEKELVKLKLKETDKKLIDLQILSQQRDKALDEVTALELAKATALTTAEERLLQLEAKFQTVEYSLLRSTERSSGTITTLELQLAAVRAALVEANEKVAALQETVVLQDHKLQSSTDGNISEVSRLERELEKIKAALSKAEVKASALERTIEEKTSNLSESVNASKLLEVDLVEATNEVTALKTNKAVEITELKGKLVIIQSTKNELLVTIQANEGVVQSLRQQLFDVQGKLNKSLVDQKATEVEWKKAKNALADAVDRQSKLQEAKAELDEANRKIEELKESIISNDHVLKSGVPGNSNETLRIREALASTELKLIEAGKIAHDLEVDNKAIQLTMRDNADQVKAAYAKVDETMEEHQAEIKALEMKMVFAQESGQATVAAKTTELGEVTVELRTLEGEVSFLREQVRAEKFQTDAMVDQHKKALDLVNAKVTELKDALLAKEQILQSSSSGSVGEARRLENELASTKTQLSDTQKKAQQLEIEERVLQAALADMEASLKEVKATANQHLIALKQSQAALERNLTELSDAKASIVSSKQASEAVIVKLEADLVESEDTYKQKELEATNNYSDMLNMQSAREEALEEMNSLRVENKVQTNEIEVLKKTHAAGLVRVQADLAAETTSHAGVVEQLNEIVVEVRVLQDLLDRTKAEAKHGASTKDTEIYEMKSSLLTCQVKSAELEASLQAQEAIVKNLREQLADAQKSSAEEKKLFRENSGKLQASSSDHSGEQKLLEIEVDHLNSRLKAAKSENAKLSDALTKAVEAQRSAQDELLDERKRSETKIATLHIQLTDIEKQNQKLSEKLREQGYNLSLSQGQLQSSLSESQKVLAEEKARNSDLQANARFLANDLEVAGRDLLNCRQLLEQMSEEKTVTLRSRDTMQVEIEIMERKLRAENKAKSRTEGLIQELQGERDQLRRDISLLQRQLMEVTEELTRYKSQTMLSQSEDEKRKIALVNIGPKTDDPDQEALEAGMLLSKQESKYGTNMFDSIKSSDETVIEEYIDQGFSRVEAIQMIFEDRYGKVADEGETHSGARHLRSMPTIGHRASAGNSGKVSPDRQSASLNSQSLSSSSNFNEEAEIALIMTHGYDRQQATSIVSQKASFSRTTTTTTNQGNSKRVSSMPTQLPPSSGRRMIRVGSSSELLEAQSAKEPAGNNTNR